MLIVFTSVIAAVAVGLLIVLLLRKPQADPGVANLQRDVALMRESTDRTIQAMSRIFSEQLQSVATNVQSGLATMTDQVSNRLSDSSTQVTEQLNAMNHHVAEQLNENVRLMSTTTNAVGDKMSSVQMTFAGLQKQVGEMTEQARQLSDVSKSIGALERIFNAPKLRGGFGETQLENMLSMVFANEQYVMQYEFPSREVADAVLLFPQGKVAIDAKFPLENFRRMVEAQTESEAERKSARRDFLKDVRKRIDEIASKYIRPADGTLPFALMYIPAENVYYESIVRDEQENDLYSYCLQRRVLPVSPNSLYAYLQTIVVGLNSMRISQKAESILKEIESLKLELEKFETAYETVGKHLRNASSKFDESSKVLDKVENRVNVLAGAQPAQPALFEGSASVGELNFEEDEKEKDAQRKLLKAEP